MQRIIGINLVILLLLSACTGATRTKEQDEKSAVAYTRLGVGYLRQGNRIAAMDNLQKAIKINPKDAAAQHAIALAYQHYGRPELADKHYLLALGLDDENGLINNNYGGFLCQEKRYSESVKYFDVAVKDIKYETPSRALENAGLCALGIPDNKVAETYFRRAIKINQQLPVSLLELAKLSLQNKKYMSVRAFIQRYENVAKHTPESLWLAIQAERKLKDKTAVARFSIRLESGFPDSKEAQLLKESKIGS